MLLGKGSLLALPDLTGSAQERGRCSVSHLQCYINVSSVSRHTQCLVADGRAISLAHCTHGGGTGCVKARAPGLSPWHSSTEQMFILLNLLFP